MTVEAGHQAVSLEHRGETVDVFRQAGGVDGRVLDECHRPARTFARGHQQPQPGRSDLEQCGLVRGSCGSERVIPVSVALPERGELLDGF